MYKFTKTVEHRHDQHIHNIPMHEALVKFLDERLVAIEFEDNADIEPVLETWPQYMQQTASFSDKSLPRDWRLYLNMNGEIFVESDSTNASHYIAKVVNKTETVMQPAMPGS